MRQSSHLPRALPPCVAAAVLAVALSAAPGVAQDTYRVTRTENFRRDGRPDAPLLATIPQAIELRGDSTANGWVRVTLEGWIWAASVEPTTREGFGLVVTPGGGENLRAEPNGPVVARLASGCLLDEVARRPGWVRVRRRGWMWGRSLERVGGRPAASEASPPPAAGGGDGAASQATAVGLDRAVTTDRALLRRTPGGSPTATLAGAPVRVLARSGEWVRVQTEGWIRETDLRPAAPGVLVGVTGAEVRSNPREFEGKLVQWTVQFIAIQEANELRREIPEGQPYMLARGPVPEAGFVYVIVTDEQRARVEQLPPLADLVIIGRVRVARSRYLDNPVLELVDLAVRNR